MCILVFWGCSILKMSIKSTCSIVSFRTSVPLLILCLEDLSMDASGVLKSPAIIVFLLISPFMSTSICFMYLGSRILGAYMVTSIIEYNILFLYWCFYHYMCSFLSFFHGLCFKVYFVWYECCYPHFLVISICMEYLFPFPHFQSLCVFLPKVGLL